MRKLVNIAFLVAILLSIILWQNNFAIAITILILSLLVYSIFNIYGSLYLSSNYFIKAHTQPVVKKEKTAVLTFDDGPILQTDDILQVLEKHNCKASFFIIGQQAETNMEILKKIHAAGHIIGNHSYYHKPSFPIQLSRQIQNELVKTNELIKKAIGKTPRFFRPPFGAMSPFVAHASKQMGVEIIGWNVRSFDTENNMPKTALRVREKTENKTNVILLLHDSTKNIAELLDSIIIYLKENNYKIIPLSDALNLAPYVED